MWWAIAKAMLDKNNSPAWQRVNNIMSIWNMSKSASNSAKSAWNRYQTTTTGE